MSMISSSSADLQRADHATVAIGDLQRDHALAAAAVRREVLERRELAEAVFGGGENVALLGHDQRIDALLLARA